MGERWMGKDNGQRSKASGTTRLHGEKKRKEKIKDVKWPASMRAESLLVDNGDADAEQENRLGRYA